MNGIELHELELNQLERKRDELLSVVAEKESNKTTTKKLFEILGVIDWKKVYQNMAQ